MVGYSDASLGRNDHEGKSTSGGVVLLFGDSVNWFTTRQKVVAATSTMEAEYIAMTQVTKKLMAAFGLILKFIKVQDKPILYSDSSAALCAVKAEVSKALTHLYHLEYHFVRQAFVTKSLVLRWVSSKEQLADTLTKALPKSNFEKLRERLLMNFEHPLKGRN